jgi:hypothetical protein
MTDENELDARVEYLSGLAVISLESFPSGFPGVEAAVADIKSIIRSLRELERGDADSDYLAAVVEEWGRLEIVYAVALHENRSTLIEDEESETEDAVANLLEIFRTRASNTYL